MSPAWGLWAPAAFPPRSLRPGTGPPPDPLPHRRRPAGERAPDGPNASFVSPEDIDQVEVLRSPSSVFYGSDAIGGVIHLLTKRPGSSGGLHGRLSTGYGSVNGEKRPGVSLEGGSSKTAFLLSLQNIATLGIIACR